MSLGISVKAVLWDDAGRVLLGRNSREEWELLGGRPDPEDATPRETLRRELLEEAGLAIDVGPILDSWIYDLGDRGRVCIVTYLAAATPSAALQVSEEHSDLRWFTVDEALAARMPQGYKDSIQAVKALPPVT